MRVCFFQLDAVENMGVMYLSASLKAAGHSTDLILARLEHNPLGRLRALNPDVVAFSVTTGNHRAYLEWASIVKGLIPHTHIVMGGAHATFSPEVIEHPALDAICRGEGEAAFCEYLDRQTHGGEASRTRNFWVKQSGSVVRNPVRPLIGELDSLPHPDRGLYYDRYAVVRQHPAKYFLAGRGCPFDCSFCHNHCLRELYGNPAAYVRLHSPAYLTEDVLAVRDRYGLRTAVFTDDQFGLDVDWLKAFLPRFARTGLRFTCSVRADVMNRERVDLLAQNGCHSVCFGVETGVEEKRREVLDKPVTNAQLEQLAAWLHEAGIPFLTNNMMGFPGESLADAVETVRLNARLRTAFPWCSLFQPYPGTRLGEQARKLGLVPDRPEQALRTSFFRASPLTGMPDIRAVSRLQKLFVLGVKAPFLIPALQLAARLPLTVLYDWVFLVTFGWRYMRSNNLRLREAIRFGRHTLAYYRRGN
ncbi:MAG: B12-binding domain-containing radical SAM protein [Kiritimatiellae bacterium]|nr:B12-binding domain-containing radical SAM protein [Kiritimatiellia bacterium]